MQAIRPYVPINNPRLDSTVYEMILANLLGEDIGEFAELIRRWPMGDLYDPEPILQIIEDRLISGNASNQDLLETAAAM